MTATIVQLSASPSLNDIPGCLRQLADQIEQKLPETEVDALLVVIPGPDNDWPILFNYGRYLGNRETIGLFELAKIRTIDLARSSE